MFYILTNLAAFLIIIAAFYFSIFFQKSSVYKVSIKNIILIALFVALSVVLTNLVGYSRIFGFQIMIGNFMIFLSGVIFGPFFGVLTGVCSDLTGSLINLGGSFHLGFMLAKVTLGFIGGFVFWSKVNRWWLAKMFFLLCLSLCISSFFISPIAMISIKGIYYVKATYLTKFIIVPLQVAIYFPIIYSCMMVSYVLLKADIYKSSKPWFLKNGQINFIIWKK